VTPRPRHGAQSIRLAPGFALAGQGIAVFSPGTAGRFWKKGEPAGLPPDRNLEEVSVRPALQNGKQPERARLFVERLIGRFRHCRDEGEALTASEEAFAPA
jgi:hypothetical protein